MRAMSTAIRFPEVANCFQHLTTQFKILISHFSIRTNAEIISSESMRDCSEWRI